MKIRKILQATLVCLLVLLWSASFIASPTMAAAAIPSAVHTQTFSNPNPAQDDNFGYTVAIDGDRVVIGADNKDGGATKSGAAYLFKASTGELMHTFSNPTPANQDNFGNSVAIDGDFVVIGAYNKDAEGIRSGTAYLFKTSNGELVHTLSDPNPYGYNSFGSSVAIDGDNTVIGAELKYTGDIRPGAAYLFKAITGELTKTFSEPNPAQDDNFGYSVAIDGDYMVIGAIYKDTGATQSGAAYLFKVSTGELVHTFSDPNPAENDNFGYTVAIDGDYMVIGAIYKDTGAKGSGAAYLFNASTGELMHTFSNPNPAAYDSFGSSVAIDGDHIVIGANGKNTGAKGSGAAYLFNASTGELVQTFSDPNPAQDDYFGYSVAIDGDNLVIGAYQKDAGAKGSGAAYLYSTIIPPNLANPIPDQTATANQPFSFTVPSNTFSDPDGDSITLSATLANGSALPSWLNFNSNTNTLSGTPAESDVGNISIKITANDGHGETTSDSFTLTIQRGNQPPVVNTPIPDQTATATKAFSFTIPSNTFSDPDGDSLTLSATLANGSALPSWLNFNPSTNTLSGTPAESDVGNISIKITANDGHGGTVSDSFKLTIAPNLIVNIDATKNNKPNPVIKSLAAGTYKIHVINTSEGGEFDAYDTDDSSPSLDCDANGFNCETGWETRYYYRSPKYHKIIDTSCTTEAHPSNSCHYSTAAKAAAHPPSDSEFTLSSQTDVKFYIYDSTLNNNEGGLSLEIIKQ